MQSLQALKRQGFQNFEVLIVDNGDNEAHKNIESTILSILDNAVIMHCELKGAAHARNRGKTHAKGKYVLFLDDDEFFKDGYLLALHDYILANKGKNEVIKTGTLFENKYGSYIKEGQFREDASLLPQIWKYGASMSDYCFNTYLLKEFNFDTKAFVIEDFLFLNQVLSNHKAVFTPIYGVKIPYHTDRISYKKFDSAYIYMKLELSIIKEAYTINKDVISFSTAWKKSLKTILAYGKRITKAGNIGQIGKLILISFATFLKLLRIVIT